MVSDNAKKGKPARSYTLTPKAISILDQLSIKSGMNKSEIMNMLIIDYEKSLEKKICP